MGRQVLWLFLIILMILSISVASGAASNRTALVIGNSSYKSSPLNNPVNDATDMMAADGECLQIANLEDCTN
ncbi:MAG: hypothetical protein U9N77_13025 [Thermodesulfobacteriota bacterium]|nr:hypothetical protein [Thermodesulfobacteriota bacterium]